MWKDERSGKLLSFGQKGFTLIELLLVIVIIGILVLMVFVSIGRQREKAKFAAVIQAAGSVLPLARDCHFRRSPLPENPRVGEDICPLVDAQWPEITVNECDYGIVDNELATFIISCPNFGKNVVCGFKSDNYGCEEVAAESAP